MVGGRKSVNAQAVVLDDSNTRNDEMNMMKRKNEIKDEKQNGPGGRDDGSGRKRCSFSFGRHLRKMSEHMDVLQQPSSSGLPKGESSVQMSGLHECAAGHDQSSGVKVDLCDLGSQSGLKQTPADVNLSTSPTPMCTNIPPNVVASSVLTTGDAAAVGATTCLQEPVVPRQDGPLSEEHILRYFGPVPTESA